MKISERMKRIKNPIARVVLITLSYISVVIILVHAIPYAMVKGLVNTEYYEEWLDFINKYIFD